MANDLNQEREAFEAWARNGFELHRHGGAEYSSHITQCAWAAWQARAALAAPAAPPPAAQAAPAVPQWPRVFGVSRDMHPRCLVISLAAEPTDDQVRAIHAALTTQGESHVD